MLSIKNVDNHKWLLIYVMGKEKKKKTCMEMVINSHYSFLWGERGKNRSSRATERALICFHKVLYILLSGRYKYSYCNYNLQYFIFLKFFIEKESAMHRFLY